MGIINDLDEIDRIIMESQLEETPSLQKPIFEAMNPRQVCYLEDPEDAIGCQGAPVYCNCGHYACTNHHTDINGKLVCDDCLAEDIRTLDTPHV